MSHSSVSRRRRAAARRTRPVTPPSMGPAFPNPAGDEPESPPSTPLHSDRGAFTLRPLSSRPGALDDAGSRRQPLPPLPSVHLSPLNAAKDSPFDNPSASGRRASALAPFRPSVQREPDDEYPEVSLDRDSGDESGPQFAAFRAERAHRDRGFLRRRSAFSLRERDWRTLAWIRRVRGVPAVGALVAILLIVGAFALVLASRAASSAGNRLLGTSVNGRSSTQAVVVQAPQTTAPTTTDSSPYQVGVWTSTYAPGTSGTIQVYVRVSENPTPIANVPVSVVLQIGQSSTPYGPTKTDSDGIAVFNVFYSGATAGQPIYAIATATISGQTVRGQTTFVAGAGASSNSTNNNNQPPNQGD